MQEVLDAWLADYEARKKATPNELDRLREAAEDPADTEVRGLFQQRLGLLRDGRRVPRGWTA